MLEGTISQGSQEPVSTVLGQNDMVLSTEVILRDECGKEAKHI